MKSRSRVPNGCEWIRPEGSSSRSESRPPNRKRGGRPLVDPEISSRQLGRLGRTRAKFRDLAHRLRPIERSRQNVVTRPLSFLSRRESPIVSKAVIETHELTKKFGEFTALDRLTISVESGRSSASSDPTGRARRRRSRSSSGCPADQRARRRSPGVDCVARRRGRSSGWSATCRTRSARTTTCGSREYLDFFGAAFGIPRRERGRGSTKCWR